MPPRSTTPRARATAWASPLPRSRDARTEVRPPAIPRPSWFAPSPSSRSWVSPSAITRADGPEVAGRHAGLRVRAGGRLRGRRRDQGHGGAGGQEEDGGGAEAHRASMAAAHVRPVKTPCAGVGGVGSVRGGRRQRRAAAARPREELRLERGDEREEGVDQRRVEVLPALALELLERLVERPRRACRAAPRGARRTRRRSPQMRAASGISSPRSPCG